MKKPGSHDRQRQRRKQERLAKTKAKRKAKSGHTALAVVPDLPDSPVFPDRRALEGAMANMVGGGAKGPLGEAQQLMYEAWDTRDTRKRVAFAREALRLSPYCADAYNLLAEELAGDIEDATQLYRKGVEAGERALGPRAFEEHVGHFWGLLETRPYMRARAGLAQCLWASGKREEAVGHYLDMLRLNPNDNQGLRWVATAWLLVLGRNDDTAALLQQFEGEDMAAMAYAAALLAFRREGDSGGARAKLKAAVEANGIVPAYLLGAKKMPERRPDYIGLGDDNEAVSVAADHIEAWLTTPGALDWLMANAGVAVGVGAASKGGTRGFGRILR